ncbi:BTB/POZ domain containing protein [Acanthamoeba castellanii str. Neff]|uniref:BTB/POZ domain containing protein n=1 Tax=Acanthamoeba castellanii (strain ATCC 30010 / Neff) TaxID=1257118 RepID=L8GIG3_ACACF|nr:BTB/POZ domain containing protein [Acanthamoeba castellanii str. Neff]ELR12614.1 BTB/POZ domain containing protein [Acanthamoeba castellanii str. Neff]
MQARGNNAISQFVAVTGADEDTAKYYLEANGYDLEAAAVQSGGAGAAPKKDAEDTGAKNVGLEFDAQAYGEQLQRTFAVLLDESDPHAHAFSDVTLVVHGEKVPAHRVILSAWSPVLRDYLLANADKREVELQLPHQELSVPVFKQVLRFIYTGCTELSKEIAIPLLELSNQLQVQSLKDKTSEFIFVAEQKKDIGHLLELARKYESKHLEKRCAAHLADRFEDCLRDDSLNSLPVSTWSELLLRDDIRVSNEEDVFKAVIKYAQTNPVTKDDTLKALLPLVRFELLPNRFLVEEVDLNPELKELAFVHALVHEAYRQKLYQQTGGAPPTARRAGRGKGRGVAGGVWSSALMSPGIEVLEGGKTVRHTGAGKGTTQSWQSVALDSWLSSGTHVYTFKIDKNASNWLFIGVAARSWEGYTDTSNGYVGHYHDSWGFGSYTGWGRAHASKNSAFGPSFKTGDVVQMTVNMDLKTVAYSVNDENLGVCHKNIADEVCPAVTLYKKGDQITLQA